MTLDRSVQTKKILRMTNKRKEKVIEHYLSMYEEELAYYFTISGIGEQTLIMEALNSAPKGYREKTAYYIKHPIELREALAKSGLEHKTK